MAIDYSARDMTKPTDPDIRLLAALADPARLGILRELAGSSEVCACDLTDCCDLSQPTVSHHLKVLREAGAVVAERRGTNIVYRVSPALIEQLGGIARSLVPGGLVQLGGLAASTAPNPRLTASKSASSPN
jgi:ArsR family transcriptional regulator